jgi:hypothetical protein
MNGACEYTALLSTFVFIISAILFLAGGLLFSSKVSRKELEARLTTEVSR